LLFGEFHGMIPEAFDTIRLGSYLNKIIVGSCLDNADVDARYNSDSKKQEDNGNGYTFLQENVSTHSFPPP
jgi:hypothetical protein